VLVEQATEEMWFYEGLHGNPGPERDAPTPWIVAWARGVWQRQANLQTRPRSAPVSAQTASNGETRSAWD